jgi:exopolysaccharide biosynthesis polyprenyl glycosylphosphotransferase
MSTLPLAENVTIAKPVLDRKNQMRLFLLVLLLSDVLWLTLAFTLAYYLRFQSGIALFVDDASSKELHVFLQAVMIPIWLGIFNFTDLYNPHYLFSSTQEYKKIFSACSIAFTLVVVVTFMVPLIRVSRGWMVVSWITAILLLTFGRFMIRRVVYYLRGRGWLTSRALIVGVDEEARAIARQIMGMPSAGVQILGFIDRYIPYGSKVEGDLHVVGSIDNLSEITELLDIDELIISTSAMPREDVLHIFQTFGHSEDIELRFSPGLFEIYTSGVRVKEIGNVSLVSMRKVRLDGIETTIKLITDYTIAIFALIVLAPFLLFVGLLIKLDSPGPILYRRRVIGAQGRQFDAFKFRTMYINGDEILAQHPDLKAEWELNQKLKDDPRVTRVGRWIRKFSIDELPQLLNVLLGQMSIVGPRMITPAELAKYGKWRLNLWTVKPGITGLWQISGRSDVSYDERVRLDLYYIRNYTFWFDIQILWRTLPVVLSRRGAY